MLNARNRFHGRAIVRRVYRFGKTARSRGLSATYVQRHDDKPFRVAVVVSKKVLKSAVGRNRIRRRIYDQARLMIDGTARYDIIITVYDEAFSTMEAASLSQRIAEVLAITKVPLVHNTMV